MDARYKALNILIPQTKIPGTLEAHKISVLTVNAYVTVVSLCMCVSLLQSCILSDKATATGEIRFVILEIKEK